MDFRGKVILIENDTLQVLLNDKSMLDYFLNHIGTDLSFKVKKYRENRSLNANSYMWVLLQKIAEVIKSDKWSVYLECLRKYSRVYDYVIVPQGAAERFTQELKKNNESRVVVNLGTYKVKQSDGSIRECEQLQVYYGSSEFDTKEMSVLLNGVVADAQELGIETIPPEELKRLKEMWRK